MAKEEQGLELDNKPLEIYYLELLEPQVDARLGKLAPGQVVPLDKAKATRWVAAGVARQTTRDAFDKYRQRKADVATAQQEAFRNLNTGHAMWDVATYRDVLTAPEGGLRTAWENGISLVNVQALRDENGHPLPPNADIEDILDARALMHPSISDPLSDHERSSVMGGGSPVGPPSSYGMPQPLHPMHRAMQERIAEQERYAQRPPRESFVAPDEGARSRQQGGGERASRAQRRQAGRVSPAAREKAAADGLKEPKPATGEQVGN